MIYKFKWLAIFFFLFYNRLFVEQFIYFLLFGLVLFLFGLCLLLFKIFF